MNRRDFLSFAAGSTVTALSCGAPARKQAAHTGQPSIVVILMDDAGWRDFGYHGSQIRTPTIDRMAREGVELHEFYAFPTCTPTRASLMTGRPASRVGVLHTIGAHDAPPLTRDQATVASILRRAGYDTAMTGKWHLGNELSVAPDRYGFNHAHGHLGPWVDYYRHRTTQDKITWHRNGEFIEEEGHATDLIGDEAIRFLSEKRDRDKPFFLYVAFNAPHRPLQEEERWIAPYRAVFEQESRRFYAGMVTHVDRTIGRILSELDRQKVSDNTLVIFFSDNGGESSGAHEHIDPTPTFNTTTDTSEYGNNTPFRGAKNSMYEGGIRVPAIMYWPGTLEPRRVDDPLIVYDVTTTILARAGVRLRPNEPVDGIDVWPAVTGAGALPDRPLYIRLSNQMMLRQGGWKLIHHGETPDVGRDELFDIENDPYEENDLAATAQQALVMLKQELGIQYEMDMNAAEQRAR